MNKKTGQEAIERKKKKEYLKGVFSTKIAIARLEEEKEELTAGETDPLPENIKLEKENLEKEIRNERYKAIKKYQEIREHINQIPDELERSVLIYKYLLGWNWERVQERIGYEREQTRKIHNRALSHLEIE